MVGWQRYLQSVLRQVGKRLEHNYIASANFSCHHSRGSLVPGELPYLQSLRTSPSLNNSRTLYHYLQQLEFSSSRRLLADASDAAPIPSPLTPVLAIESGKTEDQTKVSKPSKVQAVLKDIKQAYATLLFTSFIDDLLTSLGNLIFSGNMYMGH